MSDERHIKMVDHKDHRSIGTLIALDDAALQRDIIDSFAASGFPAPHQAANPAELRQALTSQDLDLIVMSAEMGGEFVAAMISEIRRGSLGKHPFPIVLALVADADSVKMRQVSNCGPDDQIALPCDPQELLDRINIFLSGNRRPLVVTPGYAGPERRVTNRI
jgi:DNA-binding response OmpR family regulator